MILDTLVTNEHTKIISSSLIKDFPQIATADCYLTEYLLNAIIASNQIRYGSTPGGESIQAIRTVIEKYVNQNLPIPFLVPFGSRKTVVHAPLDAAEVFAMKMLACLQDRITDKYSPGIQINMRVEDVSGNYLFAKDGEPSRIATDDYCIKLKSLVKVMEYDFINVILERDLFTEHEFVKVSNEIIPALYNYLTDVDMHGYEDSANREPYHILEQMNWRGGIPQAQRDYYRERYKYLYPEISLAEATMLVAVYLSGAWARRRLNGIGTDSSWGNDYLRLTFAAAVPGAPTSLYSRDIFYRTVPLKYAATNIAPWRAKGFFEVKDGFATPKLASWREPKEYIPLNTVFKNSRESVEIKTDYIIK